MSKNTHNKDVTPKSKRESNGNPDDLKDYMEGTDAAGIAQINTNLNENYGTDINLGQQDTRVGSPSRYERDQNIGMSIIREDPNREEDNINIQLDATMIKARNE